VGISVDTDAGIILIYYLHTVDFSPLLPVKPNEEKFKNFSADITSIDLKHE